MIISEFTKSKASTAVTASLPPANMKVVMMGPAVVVCDSGLGQETWELSLRTPELENGSTVYLFIKRRKGSLVRLIVGDPIDTYGDFNFYNSRDKVRTGLERLFQRFDVGSCHGEDRDDMLDYIVSRGEWT